MTKRNAFHPLMSQHIGGYDNIDKNESISVYLRMRCDLSSDDQMVIHKNY